MTGPEPPARGTIGWHDLTVPDADGVRDFYAAVIGWESEGCDMGDYDDYNMYPPVRRDGAVAGVCHARGVNADLPPVWMIYIVVEDIWAAVDACRTHGGDVMREPTGDASHGWTAFIRDPAGAACALYQAGS